MPYYLDKKYMEENHRITGEEIKRAKQKIKDKFYKIRSKFKTLRDDQDEIYTEMMNKLATDDLRQTADYEGTKEFLRTQFVKQFCDALRSVSLNAYKEGAKTLLKYFSLTRELRKSL